MSVNTITYDQVPPIRPGVDDMGGAAKQNARRPPDPQRSLAAEDINQMTKQVVALAATQPVAVISIKTIAGPSVAVDQVIGMGSAASNPATYTPVRNGAGDVSITWPVSTFPGRTASAKGSINGATVGGIAFEMIANGVRVRTKDMTNANLDTAFTVEIYGQ